MDPKIWVEMTAITQAKTLVKRGATWALNEAMDIIKGENTHIIWELENCKAISIIQSFLIVQ